MQQQLTEARDKVEEAHRQQEIKEIELTAVEREL